MTKKKVVIIGPESSGNRWIARIFAQHPDITVYNRSYPTLKKPFRHFPSVLHLIAPYKPCPDDLLIILCRDKTITSISARQHGEFDFDITHQAIVDNIKQWAGKIAFFSYETLVVWQSLYLKWFLQTQNINPNDKFIDYNAIDYQDGNAKYYNE